MVLLLFSALLSEDIVVIANSASGLTSLRKAELRMIFLGKRRFWHELKLLPLNLPPQKITRQKFEQNILNMDAEKLDTYWMIEHYKGHRPPYRVESVESMILFVKKVKGAIGYVPVSMLKGKARGGVKVIYRIKE